MVIQLVHLVFTQMVIKIILQLQLIQVFNSSTYVMGVALDMDNRKMYLSRNGVWTNG